MYRVLFTIPLHFTLGGLKVDGIPVYAYGVMLCIGFIVATYVGAWRAKRQGQDRDVMFSIAFLAFVGGIVGSRGFYVIQHASRFTSFWQMVNIRSGGLTYFGGLLLASAMVLWYLRRKKLNILQWVDITAPSLALGLAFGRIGCFLNGCCWGAASRVPWAFSWPAGTLPWNAYANDWQAAHGGQSVPLDWHMPAIHPTQLYSFLNAVLIFIVLSFLFRWKRRHGQILGIFFVLVSGSRFLLEVLRADEPAVYLFGIPTLLEKLGRPELVQHLPTMTISQNVGIVVFVLGLVFLRVISRSPHAALQVHPPAGEQQRRRKQSNG